MQIISVTFAPLFSKLAFRFPPFGCISLLPAPNSDYILSLLYKDRGWLMEAVRIEKVAAGSAEVAFLTGCAGISNRAADSPKQNLVKTGAEQSRDKSWSADIRMLQPQLRAIESGHFCSKLNRQRIKFRKARNSSLVLAQNSPISNRVRHSPLTTGISNRELLELEIPQPAENKHRPTLLIANFEPSYSVAQAGQS